MTKTDTPEARAAMYSTDKKLADRYVIITNGDDTFSLRDTVDHVWIELRGQEDMTEMEAHDLRQEYIWS